MNNPLGNPPDATALIRQHVMSRLMGGGQGPSMPPPAPFAPLPAAAPLPLPGAAPTAPPVSGGVPPWMRMPGGA